MAVAQRSGRSRYRLGLLVLTALTVLTLDARGFGPIDSAQRAARDALEPVTDLASSALSPVADAWNGIFDYGDLRDENEALRSELEALRGESLQAEADRATLERLLEATELDYVGDLERVAARVVRGPVGNFDDDVVTIDKGSDDGLAPGMAVVTGAGFVGRLDRVDARTSTVTLASDPDLAVGVRLVDIDRVGLGRGVGDDVGAFLVDRGLDWPAEDDESELPAIGSAVVTAAESQYPADIPVGTVESVEPGEGGLTMEVTVRLSADVDDLGFVSVITETADESSPVVPLDPGTPALDLGEDPTGGGEGLDGAGSDGGGAP